MKSALPFSFHLCFYATPSSGLDKSCGFAETTVGEFVVRRLAPHVYGWPQITSSVGRRGSLGGRSAEYGLARPSFAFRTFLRTALSSLSLSSAIAQTYLLAARVRFHHAVSSYSQLTDDPGNLVCDDNKIFPNGTCFDVRSSLFVSLPQSYATLRIELPHRWQRCRSM